MKRKTSTLPTRIWTFGCLFPTINRQLYEAELYKGHTYYNGMVAIEHRKRTTIVAARATLPDVAAAQATVEALKAELAATRAAIKAERSAQAKKKRGKDKRKAPVSSAAQTVPPGMSKPEYIFILKQRIEEAQAHAKRARHEQNQGAFMQQVFAETQAKATEEIKALRASPDAPYWGTYLLVEKAFEAACKPPKKPSKKPKPWEEMPHFKHWQGEGRVGVQVKDNPASWYQIDPVPADCFERGRNQRRRASRTTVRIRVGSVVGKPRIPVWTELPVTIHRPLPADAAVKWAWILRRKVGIHYEYRLQLSIESATFHSPATAEGNGRVAVDLGWRVLPDDYEFPLSSGETMLMNREKLTSAAEAEGNATTIPRVRAAVWRDEYGDKAHVLTPHKTLRGLKKVYDLQSIRKKNFNAVKETLQQWYVKQPQRVGVAARDEDGNGEDRAVRKSRVKPETLDQLLVQLKTLEEWKSMDRLRRFIDEWISLTNPSSAGRKDNETQGETVATDRDDILVTLKAWAKQDRHLLSWEAHQRDRRINHRREQYRLFATWLAKRYSTIVIEQFNLTVFAEHPDAEDGTQEEGREQRRTARAAAPGELREFIIDAAKKTGARVIEKNAAYTTQCCHLCGFTEDFDAAAKVDHACGGCGVTWDQDDNACANLLRMPDDEGEQLWPKPVKSVDEPVKSVDRLTKAPGEVEDEREGATEAPVERSGTEKAQNADPLQAVGTEEDADLAITLANAAK